MDAFRPPKLSYHTFTSQRPAPPSPAPEAIRHGCRLMKKLTSGGSLVPANM